MTFLPFFPLPTSAHRHQDPPGRMVGLSTAACCENLDGFLDFMQTRFGSAQLLPLPKSRGRRLRSVPVLLSFFSCLLSPEFSFHCSSAHPFSFLAFALHCAHHYCRWLLRKGGETWWVPQIRLPHLRMSLCFLSLSLMLCFLCSCLLLVTLLLAWPVSVAVTGSTGGGH